MKNWMLVLTVMNVVSLAFGCAGPPKNPEMANQCEQGLNAAYEKLDFAKSQGLDGTVNWTKAASLLSAAKIQQQFEKYPNCVNKVNRALYYINEAQKETA